MEISIIFVWKTKLRGQKKSNVVNGNGNSITKVSDYRVKRCFPLIQRITRIILHDAYYWCPKLIAGHRKQRRKIVFHITMESFPSLFYSRMIIYHATSFFLVPMCKRNFHQFSTTCDCSWKFGRKQKCKEKRSTIMTNTVFPLFGSVGYVP